MTDLEGKEESAENNVTWEIVDDHNALRGLVADTIEQRIVQQLAGSGIFLQLLGSSKPNHIEQRPKFIDEVNEAIKTTMWQMRALERMLRQDPHQPIPIDRSYESTPMGKPFISLEALKPK